MTKKSILIITTVLLSKLTFGQTTQFADIVNYYNADNWQGF